MTPFVGHIPPSMMGGLTGTGCSSSSPATIVGKPKGGILNSDLVHGLRYLYRNILAEAFPSRIKEMPAYRRGGTQRE